LEKPRRKSKNVRLNARDVHTIRTLHKHKVSKAQISAEVQVDLKTVNYWLRATHEPGVPRGIGFERDPRVTKRRRLAHEIAMRVKPSPAHRKPRRAFPSARKVAAQLREESGFDVSASTIARDLRVAGMMSKVRPLVPRSYPQDPGNRVTFAKAQLEHRLLDSNIYFFSDEKFFKAVDYSDRREWVMKNERPSTREREKWSQTVAVWGCIGVDKRNKKAYRHLVILPKDCSMNTDTYINIILPSCLPLLKTGYLVADGAKPHWSKDTKAYYAANGLRVVNGWPARSPVLNPIENCWGILQAACCADSVPGTREELITNIEKAWMEMSHDVVANLCNSFGRRCEECIEDGGHYEPRW
jgi:hypothetical protein